MGSNKSDTVSVTLPDKRTLSYAIFGDPAATGGTVFYFHGWPSSHGEAKWTDEPARDLHLRVIAVDRPGFGSSTFQAERRLLDWPADVLSLADHLKIDTFGIIGVSGGCPYALACAHELPRSRCSAFSLVAGLYPQSLGWGGMLVSTRIIIGLAQWSTRVVAVLFDWTLGARLRVPEKFEKALADMFTSRGGPDAKAWEEKAVLRDGLTDGVRGALLNGAQGAAWEGYLYGYDWGFDLKDIKVEPGAVVIWHGDADVNCPVSMAKEAAKIIDNAELRVAEGQAHMSVITANKKDIIQTMHSVLNAR